MRMRVIRLSTLAELAPYADQWDRLSAGVPFRSWTWLSLWWRHYGNPSGSRRRGPALFVLCVFDPTGALVGIAPWYLDYSGSQGRAVRFLGSGEVCSDYLGVMCEPGLVEPVTESLAGWLTAAGDPAELGTTGWEPSRWDLLQLGGLDAQDHATARLTEHLAAQGNTVCRRDGPNCWRIELPASWDDYLAMLSKSHRKQARQLERAMLETGRAVLHTVERLDQLPQAMDVLVDLHQRRRRSLGQRGCFVSPRFAAFHREVVGPLLRNGQLQLHWLELDGQPAAAEYHLAGNGVVYAYQAGVDPAAIDHEPGSLITLAVLRRAIEQGYRALDFLRGDESYKAHWRAQPRRSLEVRVVPRRAAAQLRHGLWLAGSSLKHWIQIGLGNSN